VTYNVFGGMLNLTLQLQLLHWTDNKKVNFLGHSVYTLSLLVITVYELSVQYCNYLLLIYVRLRAVAGKVKVIVILLLSDKLGQSVQHANELT